MADTTDPQVQNYPVYIYRGGSYQEGWQVVDESNEPVDISSWTAVMNIVTQKDGGSIIQSLSTTNGKITNGGANGTFTAALAVADTAPIAVDTGWYEFLVTDNTNFTYALTVGTVEFDGRTQ